VRVCNDETDMQPLIFFFFLAFEMQPVFRIFRFSKRRQSNDDVAYTYTRVSDHKERRTTTAAIRLFRLPEKHSATRDTGCLSRLPRKTSFRRSLSPLS